MSALGGIFKIEYGIVHGATSTLAEEQGCGDHTVVYLTARCDFRADKELIARAMLEALNGPEHVADECGADWHRTDMPNGDVRFHSNVLTRDANYAFRAGREAADAVVAAVGHQVTVEQGRDWSKA